MDRRATLSKMLGRKNSDVSAAAAPSALVSGLAPYTGPFGFDQAAHLLRRATFGATYQQMKDVTNMGLDVAMDEIFAAQPMPDPPVNPNFTDDPYTPIGETWVDKAYSPNIAGLAGSRDQSLKSWTLNLIQTEGISIQEKMVLFWHNHFPVADINDTRFVYKYSALLRQFAVGNFKDLTKEIAIDPAMLRYLNGNTNTAASPNENFARELLELFTIGKGPLVGPSDYTNYTEQDVVEMAKVLTGWRDRGFNSSNPAIPVESYFTTARHNQTTKQLSYRFNDIQIPNMGDQEYAHLLDIIFSKDECAKFICRKLYLWFIYYDISQQVEDEVIAPMAQILVDNDYEIRPALEALLRSEHFYDILNVGPMIKNPVDFTMGVFKTFDIDFSQANLEQLYRSLWTTFRGTLTPMQMPYYDPPSVAGWKAYYQEPVFYRHWISSVTLPIRQTYTNRVLVQGFSNAGFTARVDVLKFVATLDTPEIADDLIDELVKILFPQPITQSQHDYLKGILLPGLPDYEWNIEYGDYINNPNDINLANAIKSKLTNLLSAMMSMPEFYLS
ncbi:MAG: DUF1800 domain-containing protein [Saprospiraceae bacterium]|nr:DUF1800 domain-containing protein [Saprospiraceae bacterium]MCF8248803.1 DUF1800 domain-containing protein [Saprospiraceae bacterium]MCF8279906.1 DUF1800 domain-containing protein [Bacteroidales bacterium]MCF8310088.1 DUF1800 domain-containing protein [Saprospiraceae bacterium]MCF8438988.1 DUF1800 domain-containing protein [Saprospiraceae bacterium]